MSGFGFRASVGGLTLLVLLPLAHADDVESVRARGEYLIRIMDCAACHTPWTVGPEGPRLDATRWLSGHPAESTLPAPPVLPAGPWNVVTGGNTAWAGPWGISYSSNLTPHRETGIGAWTEKNFVDSMRGGKHRGVGRDVLPPMPRYPALTDDDAHAIFAYLMSVPAIDNEVPRSQPPPRRP